MSNDPTIELQKAIRSVIKADATLATLMGGTVRFYDHVPERTDQPYIEYREGSTAAWDTSESGSSTGFGKEHTISINVWSDYEGTKQMRQILRRVYDLLQNNTSMVLSGHKLVNLRFMFDDIVPEPDGQSYHGISQYRAITEEI